MDRLKDKAALITGGGAGIGAATARLFCAQGARVCLLDANPQALRDTQAKLLAEFPQASVHTAQADIADEGQAQAAVQTAVAALGAWMCWSTTRPCATTRPWPMPRPLNGRPWWA